MKSMRMKGYQVSAEICKTFKSLAVIFIITWANKLLNSAGLFLLQVVL